MQMDWRMYRLLFINHCRAETKKVYERGEVPAPAGWQLKAVCNGVSLPRTWGKQTLLLAQDILALAISRFEKSTELSTMPDSIFAMICTTAAYLVRIKLAAHRWRGFRIPGSSDMLLQKIRKLLMAAACGPNHIPAQCAHFIAALVGTYEARIQMTLQQPLQLAEQDADSVETASQSVLSPDRDRGQQGLWNPHDDELGAGASLDVGAGMYEAMDMDDSDFWTYFMSNLAADEKM